MQNASRRDHVRGWPGLVLMAFLHVLYIEVLTQSPGLRAGGPYGIPAPKEPGFRGRLDMRYALDDNREATGTRHLGGSAYRSALNVSSAGNARLVSIGSLRSVLIGRAEIERARAAQLKQVLDLPSERLPFSRIDAIMGVGVSRSFPGQLADLGSVSADQWSRPWHPTLLWGGGPAEADRPSGCKRRQDVDQTSKLALRPDIVATVLEDGAVLLDLETKYFYSVNPPGWAILQLFESGARPAQVMDQCRRWGQTESAETATTRFIESLVADRLVTADGSPFPAQEVVWEGDWSPPLIEKHKEPLQRIMTSAFDPTLPLAE